MPPTLTETRPDFPAGTPEPRSFLGLGLAQIVASTLAAASAALAASFLGVAGTIVGAAVGALVATIASAIYDHSLRTAGSRLRTLRGPGPERAARPPAGGAAGRPERRSTTSLRLPRGRPVRAALGVVAGFALALGGITLAEAVLGHPVSNTGVSGTTLGRAVVAAPPAASSQRSAPGPGASPSATAAPTTSGAPSSPALATGTPTTALAGVPSGPPTSPPTGAGTLSTAAPTTPSTGGSTPTAPPSGTATRQP